MNVAHDASQCSKVLAREHEVELYDRTRLQHQCHKTFTQGGAHKCKQKPQLSLRKQSVSFVLSSHHNATLGNLDILSLVICYVWDFYAPQLVPPGTAEARISYRISVCLSVCLSRPGTDSMPDEIETPGLHRMIA